MNVRKSDRLGDALSYTATEWLKYGDVAEPSTREKMIMLAIEQIIKVGPADFSAVHVCDRLSIKHPMINYHFGNRDNFMAEVSWWAYQEWVKHVDRVIRSAPADPRKRLKAFVEGEIAFAQRMGGMQILIQYPMVSANTMAIINEDHRAEMKRMFEYHLALLTTCIRDIHLKSVDPLDWDIDSVPKTRLLRSPKHFLAAAKISWATHGLAMWSSGKHIATQDIEDPALTTLTTKMAVDQMKKAILQMAEA